MSTMKIELTKEEVCQAIAEYVANNFRAMDDVTADDVSLQVGQQYDHFDRTTGHIFQKAIVTQKPKHANDRR